MSDEIPAKFVKTGRGLGRGLSALLGDAESLSGAEARTADPSTQEIALDLIQRNPLQPRKDFKEEELQSLADSLRQHGIIQPLLLRPRDDAPGRYEIVAGERRWRAAQLAGLHSVPALVRKFDDLGTLEVAIVENVQRADLNPVEEAMAFQQLIDRFGRTQQAIADAVGKSRAHVANTLRLLSLPTDVIAMVRSGQLTAGHARALLGAKDPMALAQAIVDKGLSVREAERLASQTGMTKSDRDVSRETKTDPDSRALAADLSNALGLEVTIKHKGRQGGSLSIEYRTLEQLDDLCHRLTQLHRH